MLVLGKAFDRTRSERLPILGTCGDRELKGGYITFLKIEETSQIFADVHSARVLQGLLQQCELMLAK